MSGHTKGPWTIAPHSDTDDRLDIVSEYETVDTPDGMIQRAHWIAELNAATDSELSDSENDEAMETMHADARLIIAAPDLLMALKRLRDLDVDCSQEADRAAWAEAHAAIAKAEGCDV